MTARTVSRATDCATPTTTTNLKSTPTPPTQQRPKLVGRPDSAFVQLIRRNFRRSLERRFSPLLYFWGTNPQTALFGYLQGQTSDREVPRNKFQRQYLYVSDLQYLASNVDLTDHYDKRSRAPARHTATQRPARADRAHHRLEPLQLDSHRLLLAATGSMNVARDGSEAAVEMESVGQPSLIKQNISLILGQQMCDWLTQGSKVKVEQADKTERRAGAAVKAPLMRKESGIEVEDAVVVANADYGHETGEHGGGVGVGGCIQEPIEARLRRELARGSSQEQCAKSLGRAESSDSSALGSSSDSGVFAASESNSATCSSSGSSLTINMEPSEQAPPQSHKDLSVVIDCQPPAIRCSCTALYELDLPMQSFGVHHNKQQPPYHEPLSEHQPHPDHQEANSGQQQRLQEQEQQQHQLQQQQQQQQLVRREQFEFGQCALDWYRDSHHHYHDNRQVALISAGMTTGSDKKYVTDTVQLLDRLGYEVCVFIRRGVGGLKLSSAKFFSPSKWRDFEAAVVSISKQRPGARLVAIGFSFGSIELCRYLSMSGEQSLVDSALLISCPFDPEAGGRNMRKRALNRKIDAYLAKNLGKQLYHALDQSANKPVDIYTISADKHTRDQTDTDAHVISIDADSKHKQDQQRRQSSQQKLCYNYRGSVVDLASLPKIKSLVDFEDNYNRVLQNYPDSDAYAADSRLSEQLCNIKTPTLCISSEDDFMAPIKLLPIKQIEANENLCMILTKRGGHMAFIDGILWPRKPYFAQRIIEKYMSLDTSTTMQRDRVTLGLTRTAPMMTTSIKSSLPTLVTDSRSVLKDEKRTLASATGTSISLNPPLARGGCLQKSTSSTSCSSTKSSITTNSTTCFSSSSSSSKSSSSSSSSSKSSSSPSKS